MMEPGAELNWGLWKGDWAQISFGDSDSLKLYGEGSFNRTMKDHPMVRGRKRRTENHKKRLTILFAVAVAVVAILYIHTLSRDSYLLRFPPHCCEIPTIISPQSDKCHS
jgi:hypothetical protein